MLNQEKSLNAKESNKGRTDNTKDTGHRGNKM